MGQQTGQMPAMGGTPGAGGVGAGAAPRGQKFGQPQQRPAGGVGVPNGAVPGSQNQQTIGANPTPGLGGQTNPAEYDAFIRNGGSPAVWAANGGPTPATGTYGQGGAALPSAYARPTGAVEDMLTRWFMGGANGPMAEQMAPGTQFASSIAQGNVPPAVMQQYQQQQQQLQAQLADQMGGSRFGSDYGGAFGRETGRALTNLMAQTQQQALGAQGQLFGQQSGLGQGLMQNEADRWRSAQGLAQADWAASQGLPPEIAALLAAMTGVPGGTTYGRGSTGMSI